MGLTCGIVGLPNVGKSTVFNALTGGQAEASNYPFCTVAPNRGIVQVPDTRLKFLGERLNPGELVPASVEFLDVAGLVEGASRGEGLGNEFLGQLRSVDALVHVVRLFEGSDVSHVTGAPDPVRDIELVETELILADLDVADRRRQKVSRVARIGQKDAAEEMQQLDEIMGILNRGVPLRRGLRGVRREGEGWSEKCKEWGLLTDRPVLHVLNIGEDQIPFQERLVGEVKRHFPEDGAAFLPFCARLEREIMDLDPEEREGFRREMRWGDSGLERLIREAFRLLSLITFYTIVGTVIRAWTLPAGATAFQAAGRIHTDIQKGFVKAEVMHFDDFREIGSEEEARARGLVHVEGKDHPVEDGDILRIRFR